MKVRSQSTHKPPLFPFCLTVLAVSVNGFAYAQQAPVVAGQLGADPTSPRSPLRIVSSVSLTETATDNVMLSKSSAARSDFITQISPSLSVTSGAGVIQGNLRADLTGSFYREDQNRNQNYLTMRGEGRVEAWRQHGYIDLNASVSRQTISAFAPQAADSVTGTSNTSELRNFSVAPYFVDRFGNTGTAEIRYLLGETSASGSTLKSSRNNALSFNLEDRAAFGNIGWSLVGSDSVMTTSGMRDLKQQSARLTGLLKLTPQLQLRLIGGVEGNNIRSVDTTRSSVSGIGADWTPSSTSKLSALWEDRFFGPGFQISAEHRGPVHAAKLIYSKDISSTSQSLSAFSAISTYDLLMSLMQGSHPNAVERDAFVRQFMATQGLPQNLGVAQTVLANGVFLDRRVRLEMSLLGVRNTLILSAFHSDRSRFSEQSFAAYGGDFQNASRVRENSASVMLSHKLTPSTAANASLTVSRSSRDASNAVLDPSGRMRRFSADLVSRLGQKVNGSLTLRNVRGEGGVTNYSENAAVASVSVWF